MANPLLTPDGNHPALGSTSIPAKPRDFNAATDDFATVPQPFGRTLKATSDGGQSYVDTDANSGDPDTI